MKLSDDLLDSAEAIASELGWVSSSGKPQVRRVYHLREKGCPVIRKRSGIGIYAFKSELKAWLRGDDSTSSQP
jgi:phage terminase Nu1 subunit (DNA packaging protein)